MRTRANTQGALRVFEISVINYDVLEALKNNEEHPYYGDRWGELQRTVIFAIDEVELSEKIAKQYPAKRGFVIKDVLEKPRSYLM